MSIFDKATFLLDKENFCEAMNHDGTQPVVDGNTVTMIELGCVCDPSDPCGGCVDISVDYKIGDRFVWETIRFDWRC